MQMQMTIELSGINLAIVNVLIFTTISLLTRINIKKLKNIDIITYWWLTFTILTGIWEAFFIGFYDNVNKYANILIYTQEHVWNTKYPLNYLSPHKFSFIYYSEYAAYADREYLTLTNNWSKMIEGTHEWFCGLGAFLALLSFLSIKKVEMVYIENKKKDSHMIYYDNKYYYLFLGLSMGSQLLNSLLYMSQYFIQTDEFYNPNYNSSSFPTGQYLIKRPFMYVNIFWTIMPLYVLITQIRN